MATTGNHIINKVIYNVHAVPVSKAFSIKEEAAAYIKTGFSNKLQTILDKYFPGTENIYIDKLQLQLTLEPGEVDLNKYEKELLDLLEKQLQKSSFINKPSKKNKEETYPVQKQVALIQKIQKEEYTPVDAFIFFLEKGYLPWWYKVDSTEFFEQQLTAFFSSANKAVIKLVATRIGNVEQKAFYRFVHQFSNGFKYKLAAIFLQKNFAGIKELHEQLTEVIKVIFAPSYKNQKRPAYKKGQTQSTQLIETAADFLFWNVCLQIIKNGASFQKLETLVTAKAEKIKSFSIEADNKNKILQKLIKEAKEEQLGFEKKDVISLEKEDTDAADQIFVNNAGLVLLHPFLTTLFNALLIVKDDEISDRAKAIACLNYLCGYQETQPEYEWPLMKILCGMQLAETVEQLAELTDADKLECNALLQQVIDYWIALKQTSVEGLQQTFIQRFGKLSVNENGWLLQVEQKTVDILKDRLPWGVSMVKLPWMKQLLTVEW